MKNLTMILAISILGIVWSCENKKEASGEQKVEKPKTSLHEAAFFGDLNSINQHILAGSDLNQKDEYGSTPLNIAITFGKTEIAIALINGNSDLTITTPDGSTPLHSATFFGRTKIVEALLAKGVDINAKNSYGSTALASAATPFEQIKPIYDQVGRDLGPLGLKFNYDELKASRKEIEQLLETARSKNQ